MNARRIHTIHNSPSIIAIILLLLLFSFSGNRAFSSAQVRDNKKLVYLVSDTRIPFWKIMGRGIKNRASVLGYELQIYSAENSARRELEFTAKALKDNVAGIIVSPTTSSACVTILKLAKSAGIPVVISDIGTDGGEYVSFISSDNKLGAYDIGKVLTKKLHKLGWDKGRVGIVAIPQRRLNGQLRTAGFMQAMDEANIKGADIKQQVTFSEEETYKLSKEIIDNTPDLRAIWLQGSDRYNGALRAIADAGKKNDILLITFDAEPVFLDLIPQGVLVGSAMQQPYLMGQEAVIAMDMHLKGKQVKKNLQLPILAISTENIAKKLPIIKRNVLGIE
ncbi:MAG: substrate-binding domain-containing protein [Gammaproteobacteria bacterium]|nr:substrate-binding domain-containing protein [Gammaproteobacteria bacterium]